MKELVSLPASWWLAVYVDHHSRSLNKDVPKELKSRRSEIWDQRQCNCSNNQCLCLSALQRMTFESIGPIAMAIQPSDSWLKWRHFQKKKKHSQGTGQTNSRHWHQSHRRLTSDSRLLHHFNRNRLGRNDLLLRWLQNTDCQPLETNMLGFFLHRKQPPDVAEDQTIICHYHSSGVFQNQEYFSHFACIFCAKTLKLIYHLAIYD